MLSNFRLRYFLGLLEYTRIEVAILVVGFLCWVILYAIVLRNIKKYRFVEIPFLVVCANIAWELYWGFLSNETRSWVIVLGCKIWFFMDCLILYYSCKYNRNNLPTFNIFNALKFFNPFYFSVIFWIVLWLCFTYFLSYHGYDNNLGVVSAMFLNVIMSFAYFWQLMNKKYSQTPSYQTGWYKFLGTGMISIVCFLKWSNNYFLITCCLIVTVLDILYLMTLRKEIVKKDTQKIQENK